MNLLALILLFACTNKEPTDSDPTVDADNDGSPAGQDCDDADPSAYPGATEVCDGVDNDCNEEIDDGVGTLWYADADQDGFGDPGSATLACSAPGDSVADNTDCDDQSAAVNTSAQEICDGLDNDCDSLTDEDVLLTWYADRDGDGAGDRGAPLEGCTQPPDSSADASDCDDGNAAAYPGATEVCDGADNDCDGQSDEPDAVDAGLWFADIDADGYGDPLSSQTACTQPSGTVADATDCQDLDANIHPDADELCNTVDDDCDGVVDGADAVDAGTWYTDADGDRYGNPATTTLACSRPSGAVANADDCDDTNGDIHPSATEVCDGLDNDCDSVVDPSTAADVSLWYIDGDGDGYGDPSSQLYACDEPSGYCDNADDCDDSDALVNVCVCTLSAVDAPQTLVQSGSIYGTWLADPRETLGAGLIWEIDMFYGTTLVRYPSQADMVARTNGVTQTLPSQFEGTGAVVYDGYLYYPLFNSNNVVKVDLTTMTTVGTLTLSGAGYHNTYYYQWGGYSDIDLAVDETGLWAIYATSASAGNLVVSEIDPQSFTVTATYTTSSGDKRTLGNAFVVCGVLYATSSYNSSATTVSYAYDTLTGQSSTPNLSMPVTHGYLTALSYNPNDGNVYAWDYGRRVLYGTTRTP